MKTLGIDLASKGKHTAAVAIDWPQAGSPQVVLSAADLPALDDAALLDVLRAETWGRVAIDVPFGWPSGMLDVLNRWHAGQAVDIPATARVHGSPVLHRATDLAVEKRTGQFPIPVGVNTLAWVSLRAFHLLSQAGSFSDRVGLRSAVIETYPKAALACWPGVPGASTKASEAAREEALSVIESKIGLDVGSARTSIVAHGNNDHAFDALVCALVARAAMLSMTALPGPGETAAAGKEGWIHLPTAGLEALHPARYLDLDLPEHFVLETLEDGEVWMEWGRYPRDYFERLEDGSYVCAGHGGSPVFLRCVREEGERLHVINGAGEPLIYRTVEWRPSND